MIQRLAVEVTCAGLKSDDVGKEDSWRWWSFLFLLGYRFHIEKRKTINLLSYQIKVVVSTQ